MLQMPLQLDNSFGVPRQTLNRVARYIATHFKRGEVLQVWFEDEYAEFTTVTNDRLVVRYADMGAA